MLGLFGSALGIILTLVTWSAVKLTEPTWVPPQISRRVPLEVYLVPEYLVYCLLLLVMLSFMAASLPARKAARKEIADALGHN